MRRLLIMSREVARDDAAECERAWLDLRDAVHETGGRAWRFRNTRDDRRFVEFIEWGASARPLDSRRVLDGLDRLDRIAPGTRGEWEEA